MSYSNRVFKTRYSNYINQSDRLSESARDPPQPPTPGPAVPAVVRSAASVVLGASLELARNTAAVCGTVYTCEVGLNLCQASGLC